MSDVKLKHLRYNISIQSAEIDKLRELIAAERKEHKHELEIMDDTIKGLERQLNFLEVSYNDLLYAKEKAQDDSIKLINDTIKKHYDEIFNLKVSHAQEIVELTKSINNQKAILTCSDIPSTNVDAAMWKRVRVIPFEIKEEEEPKTEEPVKDEVKPEVKAEEPDTCDKSKWDRGVVTNQDIIKKLEDTIKEEGVIINTERLKEITNAVPQSSWWFW